MLLQLEYNVHTVFRGQNRPEIALILISDYKYQDASCTLYLFRYCNLFCLRSKITIPSLATMLPFSTSVFSDVLALLKISWHP